MPSKQSKRKLPSLFKNLYFLFFLNGIIISSLFYFSTESQYENQIFKAIRKEIADSLPKGYSKTDYAIQALRISNYLQERRYLVFKTNKVEGLKVSFFHPATYDLMTGAGACGSYAIVLTRLLMAEGIPVKIGQMKAKGHYGGHMFVEAKTEQGWIVLDPMYELSFKRQDGRYASFADLHQNWNFYKNQIPADYDTAYQYEGVRYTNWDKIPVVGSAVKSSLNFAVGKTKADRISLRPYLLRTYYILSWVSGILLFFLLLGTFMIASKRNSFTQKKEKFINELLHKKQKAA